MRHCCCRPSSALVVSYNPNIRVTRSRQGTGNIHAARLSASSLDQPLTEAEVENCPPEVAQWQVRCLMGYTSELLRYAKLVPTEADPALQSTSSCLACRCPAIQLSALGQCLSQGRPHWSRPSSRRAMPQTQPTTGPLQWPSLSAGYMLACWFNAWSSTHSSTASGLPLRQATGQSTAQFTRHMCYSM